jgi:hypothetical protein
MTEPTENQKARSADWMAVQLRLTAFSAEPVDIPRSGWWRDLIGEEPDIQTFKKTLHLEEIGPLDDARLLLNANPLRIDWRLVPLEVEVMEEIPYISSFSQSLLVFLPLMTRWLSNNYPLLRLAFGAELLFPVSERREGYLKLATLIPIQIDVDNSRDLFYQINRRRISKLSNINLEINRLSKWTVIKSNIGLQQGEVAFDLPGLEKHAVRLELDINTAPESQSDLGHDKIVLVFNELIELGVEIAEEGDIP